MIIKILKIFATIIIIPTMAYISPIKTNTKTIYFSKSNIKVEIADTQEKRALGLMYRTELAENKGMLFIFDKEDKHSFWMKNTYIPLDMIWINQNLEIVHIENASPCKTKVCPNYQPQKNALYVIEVNSDYTKKHDIKIGDKIEIKN